jgi:hypothetical protein
MSQKQRMRLSLSRIEALEPYELKFVAEPAAHTSVMFLKMPHKLLPEIAIASTQ